MIPAIVVCLAASHIACILWGVNLGWKDNEWFNDRLKQELDMYRKKCECIYVREDL
jgi:hypothetical protein